MYFLSCLRNPFTHKLLRPNTQNPPPLPKKLFFKYFLSFLLLQTPAVVTKKNRTVKFFPPFSFFFPLKIDSLESLLHSLLALPPFLSSRDKKKLGLPSRQEEN